MGESGTRTLTVVAAVAVVALVLVPVGGMVLATVSPPPGIKPLPATSWLELLPLAGRTLGLAALVSAATLLIGSWLAWAEVRFTFPGARLLSVMTTLPLVVPSYLMATILREAMAPRGWLGEPLGLTGRFTGFWPAALTLTLSLTPLVQILVGAALRRLPVEQEEAARSLGAGPWRRLKAVIIPHLRPTWAFAMVIVALYAISDFGSVAVLNCEVFTWELYKAYNNYDVANASRLGFGLMALVVPLLLGVRWLQGSARVERGVGRQRAHTLRRPGPGALVLTLALQLSIIGLGLVLPLASLLDWVRRGMSQTHGTAFAPIWGHLRDTFALGVVGALVATALALIPAWAVARLLRRRGWLIEHGAYLTSSLPGVLVAFGIIQMVVVLKRHVPIPWGDASLWAALEGIGALVILGYVMRFLAEGYAALKPSILRLDPRLEESARSLGAGPWRRWWRVTFPSLAPGIGAAWILLFLAIVKELPITMMLIPTGHTTLAYRIFDAQNEGLLPEIGLAGLVLLGLALAIQLALLRWRRHV